MSRKKYLLILVILIFIVFLTIVITNVMYNKNDENFSYSYDCCDNPMMEYPCKCQNKFSMIEKTLIVLKNIKID